MISFALMAHRARQTYVDELLPQLDREPTVVWDERNDRWDTGRRAMLAYDPDATHHFVLQDDAVVPRDLVAGVQNMLRFVAHDVPISLYTGRYRPNRLMVDLRVNQAVRNGCSWIRMPGPWWGVGIIVPTNVITKMITGCDAASHIANYDLRLARWWGQQGTQCLYTVPSLVDHRSGPSLVKERTATNRRAHLALTPNDSALEVEWTTRCLDAYVPMDRGVKGDVRAVDPEGRTHVVTAKSFREILAQRGWSLAAGDEVRSSMQKEVAHAG